MIALFIILFEILFGCSIEIITTTTIIMIGVKGLLMYLELTDI